MEYLKKPKNLLELYDLYISLVKKNTDNICGYQNPITYRREICFTFNSCLLIGLGYTYKPTGKKLTKKEIKNAREFMQRTDIDSLLNARKALQRGLEQIERSQKMKDIYWRSLEKFLTWCELQPWSPIEVKVQYHPNSQAFCAPNLTTQYGSKQSKKITHHSIRIQYKLKAKDISPQLQWELNEFRKFLSEANYPLRITKLVKKKVASKYEAEILRCLGWFHYIQGTPVDQLSFDLLIPRLFQNNIKHLSDPKLKQQLRIYQQQTESWFTQYRVFLRDTMRSVSPRTQNSKIDAVNALGRFQYRTEVEIKNDYKKFPILQVFYNYKREISMQVDEWNYAQKYVADQKEKWPITKEGETGLSVIQRDVLEPLRLECRPKSKSNKIRSSNSIVLSQQKFIAWFLLAGMPARRQEEHRDLKLALSCPIQRPSEVPADGVYHPLPSSSIRDKRYDGTIEDNYIHKTYIHNKKIYPKGLWVLDIQEYKMVDTYGAQSIAIKNRYFKDGLCLYDYFEYYLYGLWLPGGRKKQHIYDWWQQNLKSRRGRWVCLGRASFEPHDNPGVNGEADDAYVWPWGYFFVKPEAGGRYNASQFSEFIVTEAHHHIGQNTAPHTMREVWATWGHQVGLTDQEKESLAYAMGHDLKTLKLLYDKSPAEEKRKLIEEVIEQDFRDITLPHELAPKTSPDDELKRTLNQLSKSEKDQLKKMIIQKKNEQP